MRNKNLILALLVVCTTVFLGSCSKDDEPSSQSEGIRLISPKDGATIMGCDALLSWGPQEQTNSSYGYKLFLGTDPENLELREDDATPDGFPTTLVDPSTGKIIKVEKFLILNLKDKTTYYWKIEGEGNESSSVWSFTTKAND